MALTKVSAAMFSTAAQSSDMNMDDGTLFVDVSENKVAIGNTSPAEALDITGNLTLRSRGYLKLQDDAGGQFVALRAPATVSSSVTYTFPAADGSSGQTLSTDGSGTLSWATVAPTAGTGVTVSGTAVSIGQAVAASDSPTFTNLTLSGNLTVNGSTVTNSATNTTIEDLLIELGTGTSGSPSSDAGIIIERGSSDNVFMGWDESADVIVLGTGSFTGASSGNLTITPATLHVGSIGIGNAAPDVSLDIGSKTDAVHLPVGTTAQRPGSPAAGYFRYNSTLSKFEGYTTSWGEIGGGSTTLNTDLFTGNGSTVDFTISQAVDNENKLMVFIDGVYQNPDAYSMPANTTLRFTAAPANSRKIAVYSIAGVVSGTNLNIDSFTGDGSDLTFTLSITPVSENNTLVYVGGVYQQKSVYSVSGTTLTFGSGNAPPNGASIEVATFNQTNINVPVDDTITTAKIVNDAVTADKIVDNIALPGNITTTGTLTPTGVLTANAGVVVDNITIDGQEIDVSSGNLTIDVAGDMFLDAGGNNFNFQVAGTTKGMLAGSGDGFAIKSTVSDGDLVFQGNDGGSTITALTLDMSAAGAATFNAGATFAGNVIGSDNLYLTTNTSDGSDNKYVGLDSGGGAGSTSRGAFLGVYGNEHSSLAGDVYVMAGASGTIKFNTGSGPTERMRIDSAGNVGIGTTSLTSWASGYKSLQIGDRGFVAAHTGSDLYLGQNAYVDSGWKYEASVAASLTQHSGGQITHKVAAAGTAGNTISWTDALHIDTGGRVGIKTTVEADGTAMTSPLTISGANDGGNIFEAHRTANSIHRQYMSTGGKSYFDIYGTSPSLQFRIAGADIAEMVSTGLKFTAGKGIDFSAAADISSGETVTSSVLDDYEEGTFTPVITTAGGNYTSGAQSPLGYYTRIGRYVHIALEVSISSSTTISGGSGDFMITGLPYDPIIAAVGNCTTGRVDNPPEGTWQAYIGPGNTTIKLRAIGDYVGGDADGITVAQASIIHGNTTPWFTIYIDYQI